MIFPVGTRVQNIMSSHLVGTVVGYGTIPDNDAGGANGVLPGWNGQSVYLVKLDNEIHQEQPHVIVRMAIFSHQHCVNTLTKEEENNGQI